MGSCCAGTDRFFNRAAARYRKRFTKKGFERSQQQLYDRLLEHAGDDLTGSRVTEIGCGVGYFHQRLLQAGAVAAVGVDVASAMLDEAKLMAADMGTEDQCLYLLGDYVDLVDEQRIGAAEITVLDKVVCCYPDAEALLSRAALSTTVLLALSFPRSRILVRFGIAAMTWLAGLLRWHFHPFAHAPEAIRSILNQAGFTRVAQECTFVWQSEVYVRSAQ